MTDVEVGFDPRSTEIMDDPYPLYRSITEAARPVYSTVADCWLYGGYDICMQALADASTYSVAKGVQYEDEEDLPSGIPLLIVTDPPEHTRLRRFMAHAFKSDSIQQFAEIFRANMNAVIDGLDSGPCDVMTDLVMPWSIENSLSLLEIPESDRPSWREWMRIYLHRERGNIGFTPDGNSALEQAMVYLVMAHLGQLRNGGDTFMGRLLQVEIDGERMTDAEGMGLLMTMAVVGAEDAARTFANMIRLVDESNIDAKVITDDEAATYKIIDETIRHSPSTHYVRRTVTRDTLVNGELIPAGAKVLLLFGAANRDPNVFADPDVFDCTRENSQRALGFSRGAHSCLGIHVARLQLLVGFQALCARNTERRIDYDRGEWIHAMNISGYQSLPATMTWSAP